MQPQDAVGLSLARRKLTHRAAQVDLDQLEVELGRGKLVLHDQLLNADYLNEQLVRLAIGKAPGSTWLRRRRNRLSVQGTSAWEVKTGFVGSLTLSVPYTSLSDPCLVVLDELWLSVGPKQRAPASAKPAGGAAKVGPTVVLVAVFACVLDAGGWTGAGVCRSAPQQRPPKGSESRAWDCWPISRTACRRWRAWWSTSSGHLPALPGLQAA